MEKANPIRKNAKWIFNGIILIGVAVILFLAVKPVNATIAEDGFRIRGLYTSTFQWESIQELTLMEELPRVLRRTNGSGVGSQLRGSFDIETYGSVRLMLDRDRPPYIFVRAAEGIVIFNLGDGVKTRTLFETLDAKLSREGT